MAIFIEVIGWIGMALVLLAYLLVSANRIQGRSIPFQSLNAIAGLFLAINGWYHHTVPIMVLEGIWCLLGIGMLFSIARQKHYGRQA